MESAWTTWKPRLETLCSQLCDEVQRALHGSEEIDRPTGAGAGDVTFALDVPAEERVELWAREMASSTPLSVMTEDRGWRHFAPGPGAARRAVEIEGFDHGGPRIAFDPIDGTRNLMARLRSAWTVVTYADGGTGQPDWSDVAAGLLTELPPRPRTTRVRLSARRGGACLWDELAPTGERVAGGELRTDPRARLDQGYLPFFHFDPATRPVFARIEAAFFERLARTLGSDPSMYWDDQYISSAGHMVLLARGSYRAIFDLRALVAERTGLAVQATKPYDVAGALLCAQSAGACVTNGAGGELEFPIDTSSPLHYAGYANPAVREIAEPLLREAIEAELGG